MFYGKIWPANSLYEVGRLIFLSVTMLLSFRFD